MVHICHDKKLAALIMAIFLLVYVSPGTYWPPVKSLRSTVYGIGSVDGGIPAWLGTISVVLPQASEDAPSGRPCTVVTTSKVTTMQYIKFKAYRK